MKEPPEYFLRTIKLVRKATGGAVSVHGEVFPPFTHYLELFGYQQALTGLIADPAKAHAVLDRLTDASISWGIAQARAGVDAVLNSSAFVGGGFISRKMYREFVVPYEKRVTDAIKGAGAFVYTHTCGKIGDRLDLMVETGTQGLDTLDPPPLGNVDLAVAKQQVGKKLFLKGNMNPVALLSYQIESDVVAEATRCLRSAGPGGGYILATACSVAPRMEPWKLKMLVPLAEEIGRYAQPA
jgi:uroporphyrinogen-III decarboxylase